MRLIRTLLIVVVVSGWSVLSARADIEVGSSRQQVIQELGQPEFKFTRSGTEYYSYYGLELELEDGKVTKVPFGLRQEIAKRAGARNEELARQASLTKRRASVRRISKPKTKSGGSPGPSTSVISNGGQEVDVNRYVGRGKVTVVDFYADWCGPCRQVSPHLERLAGSDPDVNLVKIDIVKWGTPVTRQYNIRGVPNIRVYDRGGKMVGQPTHDVRKIAKYVNQAK